MADINIDDFIRELQEGSRSLSDFTSGVRGVSGSLGSLSAGSTAAANELRREANVRKEASENLKRDFRSLREDISSSVKGLVGGNTGFSQLGQSVQLASSGIGNLASSLGKLAGRFGKVLEVAGASVKILGASSRLAIEQFSAGYEAFRQAAKIGAVNTFDDLKISAGALNLRMEQLSAVLVANGENLLSIGGNAAAGARALTQLSDGTGELRKEFLKLGVSADELANLQINMAGQLSRAGFGLKDINKVQKEYLYNLDALATMAGQTREEQLKERQRRENEFRFRARMQQLGGEDPRRYANLQDRFDIAKTMLPAEDYRHAMALFGTGGRIIGQEMALDAVRSPMLRTIMSNFENYSMDELIKQFQAVSRAGIERFGGEAAQTMSQLPFAPKSGEIFDIANRPTPSLTQILALQEETRKNEKNNNARIASTMDNLQSASVKLQQAATNINTITYAINSLTAAVDEFASIVEKISQVSGPSGFIEGVRERLNNFNKPSYELNPAPQPGQVSPGVGPMYPVTSPSGAAFGMYPSTGRRNQSSIQQPVAPSSGLSEDMVDPTIPSALGTNGRQGSLPIKRALQEKLSQLAEQFPGAIITGLNDSDLVNRSGSAHILGEAVDFTIPNYNSELSSDYLSKLRDIGFTRVKDEYIQKSANWTGPHLHAALANGGITTGPSLAGEAGPEAVVPLPNGRSIPVILGENGIFEEILDELQSMRNAMESGVGLQRKQLQFARN